MERTLLVGDFLLVNKQMMAATGKAIGSRVRILPNHACATGAQHEAYQVIEGDDPTIFAQWQRMRGW